MMIQPSSLLQRGKDIPFSKLDDELLAIDSQGGYCYSLNETAGRVWDLVAAPMTLQAVCDQLRKEYTVDEATCLREVSKFAQDLHGAGLLLVNAG